MSDKCREEFDKWMLSETMTPPPIDWCWETWKTAHSARPSVEDSLRELCEALVREITNG